jgi:hypothetical protein
VHGPRGWRKFSAPELAELKDVVDWRPSERLTEELVALSSVMRSNPVKVAT